MRVIVFVSSTAVLIGPLNRKECVRIRTTLKVFLVRDNNSRYFLKKSSFAAAAFSVVCMCVEQWLGGLVMADQKKKLGYYLPQMLASSCTSLYFYICKKIYSYPYHVVNFIFAVKRSRVLVTCVVTASVVVLDGEGRGTWGEK